MLLSQNPFAPVHLTVMAVAQRAFRSNCITFTKTNLDISRGFCDEDFLCIEVQHRVEISGRPPRNKSLVVYTLEMEKLLLKLKMKKYNI